MMVSNTYFQDSWLVKKFCLFPYPVPLYRTYNKHYRELLFYTVLTYLSCFYSDLYNVNTIIKQVKKTERTLQNVTVTVPMILPIIVLF